MDIAPTEQQIVEEIRETAIQVNAAQERVEERDVVAAAHVSVERLSSRYRQYVEAWCSPCGGLTEHSIVAMVGDEPKQVVCQSCGGRHGYRMTPARKGTGEMEAAAGGGGGTRTSTPAEREAQRRADQKAAEQR